MVERSQSPGAERWVSHSKQSDSLKPTSGLLQLAQDITGTPRQWGRPPSAFGLMNLGLTALLLFCVPMGVISQADILPHQS